MADCDNSIKASGHTALWSSPEQKQVQTYSLELPLDAYLYIEAGTLRVMRWLVADIAALCKGLQLLSALNINP